MRRQEIVESILIPITEIAGIVGIFFASYFLRSITDGIPFIQLRIPYISEAQFIPFVIFGSVFWWAIFANGDLYKYKPGYPLFEQIITVIKHSFLWFFLYIGFVYLTTNFIFQKEIPRLIIIYVWILATIFSIGLRICIHTIMGIFYKKWYIEKRRIFVLTDEKKSPYTLEENAFCQYYFFTENEKEKIYESIRKKEVDTVFAIGWEKESDFMNNIIKLTTIYGVTFSYPKVLPSLYSRPKHESFIENIPVIESSSVSISPWERILKRTIDIVVSFFGLILLFPLFCMIALLIKIEDPSGPVFFKNRRIGLGGTVFSLYKFRYMYWKYSVKDAYGVDKKNDEALKYEESLKKEADSRKWPLYKIENDPRKMRVGKILEKFSLDELPQLINVLIGNMSLIGPRPHQPREVELYEERHYQVLTIKPGITGMAQVYGREKNTFEEVVSLDTHYIENYSPLLDLLIFIRTIGVVFMRAFH